MSSTSCETCKWWLPHVGGLGNTPYGSVEAWKAKNQANHGGTVPYGECRRFPLAAHDAPRVTHDFWCGEHAEPTDGWTPGREITDAELERACAADFAFGMPGVDPDASWAMLREQYKPPIRARIRAVLEAARRE